MKTNLSIMALCALGFLSIASVQAKAESPAVQQITNLEIWLKAQNSKYILNQINFNAGYHRDDLISSVRVMPNMPQSDADRVHFSLLPSFKVNGGVDQDRDYFGDNSLSGFEMSQQEENDLNKTTQDLERLKLAFRNIQFLASFTDFEGTASPSLRLVRMTTTQSNETMFAVLGARTPQIVSFGVLVITEDQNGRTVATAPFLLKPLVLK